ncbi:MAG: DUF3365 domain-containing protein [Boseongicola sp. SB0667_bin_21]|nr:DUF3365 domain-containing protein [Boseongicola sp. SB0667_bin_21]
MRAFPTVIAIAFCSVAAAFADEDLAARVDTSREVVKSFAGALQKRLTAAMAAGGPTAAIKVCRIAAPDIAKEASEARDWRVGRTSLKLRNPANAPDAWELAVLLDFEARKAAGEDPAMIDHAEFVFSDGKRTFRYMKAIGTRQVCTACHGTGIAPEVAATLDALYPEDRARGFSVGDIRGAFTITQPAP